jgi:hypothetical protein
MNRFLPLILWLSAALVLNAQGPRMTVAGTATQLEVEEASVQIRLGGGSARTEIELVFRNDTDRIVEGEFVLPLPPGATVSSYALEVNGALREAVAVEKERARHAYESIKRQMVDPGIVEREAGNVYRTRVFPIPAKGTKRLRIGYVEMLPVDAGNFLYRLPLKFHGTLAKFRCEIDGAGGVLPTLTGAVPVSFRLDGWRAVGETTEVPLDGRLEMRLALPTKPELLVEGGEDPVFLLTDVFPELPETKRPPSRTMVLFWDASESAAGVDQSAMLRALDAWFGAQGDVSVRLKFLRDRIEDGGKFDVRGGDWSALRKAVESADHGGGTSFDGLEAVGADVAMYCGDGVATLGRKMGEIACPLLVLHHGTAVAGGLRDAAARTGGAMVAADTLSTDEILKRLTTLPFRVTEVTGDGVCDVQINGGGAPGKIVRVSGRLQKGPGSIWISYGLGTETKAQREVKFFGGELKEGFVRRLWAQRKLAALEAAPVPDVAAIVAHCREHTLVSDETSLIVLERFEDHLRYEIPPPEPELRAKYEEEMARRRAERGSDFLSRWRDRLAWYATSFPGPEYVLLPRVRQIAIWQNAVKSVFEPTQLDAKSFGIVTGWKARTLALVERRRELPDAAAYAKWLGEIRDLREAGPGLAAVPVSPPPAGKPLVVSVRGLVSERGNLSSDGPMTLRQAVAKAGGPVFGGGLERVALYRNAGKTIYNTLSKELADIELRPGDMIVLEGEDLSYADPFAESTPSRPEDNPPVVERQDIWVDDASPLGRRQGFGTLGGGDERGAEAEAIQVIDPAEAGMPDLADFEARLKGGGNAAAAYLEAMGGKLRPARFYIEAARRLFANGHEELAERALSTLAERGIGSDAGRRALAFWLMEFGRTEAADRVLAEISPEKGACPAELAQVEMAANPQQAEKLLAAFVTEPGPLAEIVMTELNRLKLANPPFTGMLESLPCDLRITVLSEFAGTIPEIEVVEPTGYMLFREAPSPTGGRITKASGISEYMIRHAVPGIYTLRISSRVETTVRVAIYTNWGRESEKVVRVTKLVEPGKPVMVAEALFEFKK